MSQAGGVPPLLAPQADGDDPQHYGGQVLPQHSGVAGHFRWGETAVVFFIVWKRFLNFFRKGFLNFCFFGEKGLIHK